MKYFLPLQLKVRNVILLLLDNLRVLSPLLILLVILYYTMSVYEFTFAVEYYWNDFVDRVICDLQNAGIL